MPPSSGLLLRMDAACCSKTLVFSCKNTRCQNHNITNWNSPTLWKPNVHRQIHEGASLDSSSPCLIDSTSSQRVSPTSHVNNIFPCTSVSPKWSFPLCYPITFVTNFPPKRAVAFMFCIMCVCVCVCVCVCMHGHFLAPRLSWIETRPYLTIQTLVTCLVAKNH